MRATLVNELARRARAAGAAFRFGVGIERIEGDRQSPRLAAEPQQTWDLVIAANGAHSDLRAHVSQRPHARLYDWAALWALVPLPADWPVDVLQQRYRRAGAMAGLLPVRNAAAGPPLATFFWSIRHEEFPAWRAAPLGEWQEAAVALWPQLEPIVGAFRQHDQLHCATYRDVRMRRWHYGHVLLLGDAAHGTSPQLGNGANLAIGDAVVLARALREAADVATGLARYERARRAAVRYYQWASRALTPFFQSDARALPWLRDLALDRSCRAPVIGRYMHSTLCGDRRGWLSTGLIDDLAGPGAAVTAPAPAEAPETDHQAHP